MKYVKLTGKHYDNMSNIYCPIDEKDKSVITGLTLVGFCDDEIIGEYNMDTNTLTLQKEVEEK